MLVIVVRALRQMKVKLLRKIELMLSDFNNTKF